MMRMHHHAIQQSTRMRHLWRRRRCAMPMITVRYVTPKSDPSLRTAIAEAVPKLSAEHLGKDPGVTAILVVLADPEGWFIAGRRPTEDGKAAFWLDIKITAGTNTKGETTTFVRETFAAME